MKDDVISHFLNPFFYFSDFFDFSGSARNHNFHFRREYIIKKREDILKCRKTMKLTFGPFCVILRVVSSAENIGF